MLYENNKLFENVDDLCNEIDDMRGLGKSIVFTNGCFDILHPGHIHILNTAATKGDILIVGLNSDHSIQNFKSPNRPICNQNDRAFVLSALSCIDIIYIFDDETPEELIKIVAPDVLVKGSDYKNKYIAGSDFMKKNNKKVELVDIIDEKSTSRIIDKITKLDSK